MFPYIYINWCTVQRFQRKSQNMSQPIRGQGGHIVFWISPKNTHLVEDVENLLSVKFHWIPFSGFIGEVKNVSANHRPGRPFCFSDPPEKHKLGRGRCDLASYQVSSNSFHSFRGEVENVSANQRPFCFFPDLPEKHKRGRRHWKLASCQVSLNSVKWFQKRSRKMSQPLRGQGGHFVFPISPKNKNLVEGIEILHPIKFCWIRFSGFRGEVENVSANQRPGRPSCFSDRPRKTQTW